MPSPADLKDLFAVCDVYGLVMRASDEPEGVKIVVSGTKSEANEKFTVTVLGGSVEEAKELMFAALDEGPKSACWEISREMQGETGES